MSKDVTIKSLKVFENNNCAQATASGILDYYNDKDEQIFFNALLGFGGGFGEGSLCGAVSGSIASMTKILSDRNVGKDDIIEARNQLKDQFSAKFESLECRELTKDYADKNNEERRANCANFVREIVVDATKIIDNY